MKGPELLKPGLPSVLGTLRIRLQELKHDRDTANAQLKTVEQERYALQRLKAEVHLAEKQKECLLTRLQEVKEERDTAKAKLKTVEQERDIAKAQLKTVEQERNIANDRYKSVIVAWATLERSALAGTPVHDDDPSPLDGLY